VGPAVHCCSAKGAVVEQRLTAGEVEVVVLEAPEARSTMAMEVLLPEAALDGHWKVVESEALVWVPLEVMAVRLPTEPGLEGVEREQGRDEESAVAVHRAAEAGHGTCESMSVYLRKP